MGVQRNFKNLKNIDDKEKFDYEKLLFQFQAGLMDNKYALVGYGGKDKMQESKLILE